jgi:hypothetical protein
VSPAPTTLAGAFHAASLKYNAPEDLLLAIGWVNTHWEMQQSADGGFGVMHLVNRTTRDTVKTAATLTGHSEQELELDPAANVDGGSALLVQAQGAARPPTLNGWTAAVTQFGGGSLFAAQVFETLKRGASRSTSLGEHLALASHPEATVPPTLGRVPAAAANAPAATTPAATAPAAPAPVNRGADYGNASWIPASSANFTVSDRPTFYPVQLIIIHVSQGSYAGTIALFQDPSQQVSAHYVTRSSDGAITQTVREQDVAWHAGNWDYNTRSVGIEHEGFVNDPSWFTDAMYRGSAQLSAFLVVKYGIPIDRNHIIGHNEVPDPNNPGQFGGSGHHTDPGPYWNWNLYMTYVAQYASLISCQVSDWTLYPGAGTDLSVGANGAAWVIGTNPVPSGYGIFQWTSAGWASVAGGAVRVAVDPSGQPWVVNSYGQIFRRTGTSWQLLPGLATDIGIGADGTAWVIGTNTVSGGHGIYRWSGTTWNFIGGGAIRVAVDPHGSAWVINDAGSIYEWTAAGWVIHPGSAHEVGAGADGSIWVIGADAVPGGYDIFRFVGGGWIPLFGGGITVAVGPTGAPWIINSIGSILVGRPGVWQTKPGLAHDVGVGADGSVWITGASPIDGGYPIYKWNGSGWNIIDGGAVYIAVSPTGSPWVVNTDGSIYERVGSSWQLLPGLANDIGIGADGSAWIIGDDAMAGGYSVRRWNGSAWVAVGGAGVRIAVGKTGLPWIINASGEIWQRLANGTWQLMPGSAHDIGVGADGSVWITGTSPSCGGYGVSRWNGTGWDQYDGLGFQIAVGPTGLPWLVNSPGAIYSRV